MTSTQMRDAIAKLVNDALNDMRQERDEAKASLHNVCKDLELQRAAGIRAKPSQQECLRHELMDRASTMSNIFKAMIIDHPAIDPDEDCFSTAVHNTLSDKINAAADALNDVYQFIGDKHL